MVILWGETEALGTWFLPGCLFFVIFSSLFSTWKSCLCLELNTFIFSVYDFVELVSSEKLHFPFISSSPPLFPAPAPSPRNPSGRIKDFTAEK